ncbi:MAG: hypothetical protein WD469_02620 [Paenibacillaceae bacterium]
MKFVLFTLFSSAEYVAIFILMFALFRFRFKGYRKQIALTSIILCYVSYTMRIDGMENITTIVQFILLFILVWMLFQVQVFYAAIMSFTAFFGYGLIQGIVVLIFSMLGLLKISDIQENSLTGYTLQIGTAIIFSSIGWLIRKTNKGFDFVPTSIHGRMKFTKINLFFLFVLIISSILLAFAYYIINNYKNTEDSIIFIIILVISIAMLLYLSNRKDWEDG